MIVIIYQIQTVEIKKQISPKRASPRWIEVEMLTKQIISLQRPIWFFLIDRILQLAVRTMNQLLRNVTKFIQIILQGYQLPHELTTDLLTFNTYLESYDQGQLTGFVQQIAKRQKPKLQPSKSTQDIKKIQPYDLPSYPTSDKISSIRYPDLRIDLRVDLPTQMSEAELSWSQSLLDRSERPLSYRSGKSKENEGIKSARHKFGTRERNKTQRLEGKDINKQNTQANANVRVNYRAQKQSKPQERALKIIRSQAELLHKNNSHVAFTRQASTQTRREQQLKPLNRYESAENKGGVNSSYLRIKLRSKPLLDLGKVQEGIHLILEEMKQEEEFIGALMEQVQAEEVQLQ